MKITDLEIGQFATRKRYDNSKDSLCVRRYSQNRYEYWKNGMFSSLVKEDSSIYNRGDFTICNEYAKPIYPLFMESIEYNGTSGKVIKFTAPSEGTVIIKGSSNDSAGYYYNYWATHTNKLSWKPCDFTKTPEIFDIDYWDARFNAGLPVYFSLFKNCKNIPCSMDPSILYTQNKNIKFYINKNYEPEHNYPMYFECIANHCDKGMVIKFTSLDTGELVKEAPKGYHKIDKCSWDWTKHTDILIWKQVNFDEKLNKIISAEDDINELISNLKSIIEDSDNRFNPSERGAGTQLSESAYEYCQDIIEEWITKYHITEILDIDNEENY